MFFKLAGGGVGDGGVTLGHDYSLSGIWPHFEPQPARLIFLNKAIQPQLQVVFTQKADNDESHKV